MGIGLGMNVSASFVNRWAKDSEEEEIEDVKGEERWA